ncbi:MAG: methylaspartate ammonia-lyase [Bdellovibrionaceae bacterium]|nr:methylaspartate ammonia-lyase [Bdellovibrionales bacterium]MCB9255130.1 methylaspartate ammonia-lyase [Pseudobdellovibrionaceae bacterium]
MNFSIERVFAVPGLGAYYNEDLLALQQHPVSPSQRYTTPAHTPGMRHLRQVAEVLSLGLQLADGGVFWGDALGVSYAGKSGREGVFRANPTQAGVLFERSSELGKGFKEDCATLAQWGVSRALGFGISQALLRAHASVSGTCMTSFLCKEYSLALPSDRVELHGSCGYDWNDNVDKMVFYRLASLPAGQGDDLPNRVGQRGEKLLEYVSWLKSRVALQKDYTPVFHFDFHGGLDLVFERNRNQVIEYLCQLATACLPFKLRVESPLHAANREQMLQAYRELHEALEGVSLELVADEWANTAEDVQVFAESGAVDMIHIKMPDLGSLDNTVRAIQVCQKNGVGSLLGGSCVETFVSSTIAVPIALALRPTLLMAKSGMGVNEAVSSAHNEMGRELALLQSPCE